MNVRKRNKKKRKRRKRILRQREDEMKEILSKARDIVLPDDMYDPLQPTTTTTTTLKKMRKKSVP